MDNPMLDEDFFVVEVSQEELFDDLEKNIQLVLINELGKIDKCDEILIKIVLNYIQLRYILKSKWKKHNE